MCLRLFSYTTTHRIKMDVARQFHQMFIRLNQNGLVTPLEQVYRCCAWLYIDSLAMSFTFLTSVTDPSCLLNSAGKSSCRAYIGHMRFTLEAAAACQTRAAPFPTGRQVSAVSPRRHNDQETGRRKATRHLTNATVQKLPAVR